MLTSNLGALLAAMSSLLEMLLYITQERMILLAAPIVLLRAFLFKIRRSGSRRSADVAS